MNADSVQQRLASIFVRIHRSFSQFIHQSWPHPDLFGVERLRELVDREIDDARRLGKELVQQYGHVREGNFPPRYLDCFYLNLSRLLPDWIVEQRKLLAAVEADRDAIAAMGTTSPLVDAIVHHERDLLAALEELDQKREV